MSCSTSRIACTPVAFAAVISVRMTLCLSAVETPDVGSSSRMTSGFSANADATSSSFFSPCDSNRQATFKRFWSPKIVAIHARGDVLVGRDPGEQAPLLALLGDHRNRDRLGYGELRKNLNQLKGARHALLSEHDGAHAGNVVPFEEHLALGRHEQSGQKFTSVVYRRR